MEHKRQVSLPVTATTTVVHDAGNQVAPNSSKDDPPQEPVVESIPPADAADVEAPPPTEKDNLDPISSKDEDSSEDGDDDEDSDKDEDADNDDTSMEDSDYQHRRLSSDDDDDDDNDDDSPPPFPESDVDSDSDMASDSNSEAMSWESWERRCL